MCVCEMSNDLALNTRFVYGLSFTAADREKIFPFFYVIYDDNQNTQIKENYETNNQNEIGDLYVIWLYWLPICLMPALFLILLWLMVDNDDDYHRYQTLKLNWTIGHHNVLFSVRLHRFLFGIQEEIVIEKQMSMTKSSNYYT